MQNMGGLLHGEGIFFRRPSFECPSDLSVILGVAQYHRSGEGDLAIRWLLDALHYVTHGIIGDLNVTTSVDLKLNPIGCADRYPPQ
jgi:hypothetical protein